MSIWNRTTAALPRTEQSFLPGALLVQDTPPHPASRLTSYLILSLVVIGLLWAAFGEVDIVARAEGKVIPRGRVKIIQPIETGSVAQIWVKEGDWVEAGTPLIQLDPINAEATEKQIEHELLQYRDALRRLEFFRRQIERLHLNPDLVESADLLRVQIDLPSSQAALLVEELTAYLASMRQLQRQLAEARLSHQGVAVEITKLEKTLPITRELVSSVKQLSSNAMASRSQYLELKQQLIDAEQTLKYKRVELQRVAQNLQVLIQQAELTQAETLSQNLSEQAQISREIHRLERDLEMAQSRRQKLMLSAPVSGVVKDLAIATLGGVVTSAQELMKIVPDDQQLEVEAWIENSDIGFINVGQPAEIKLHAFPFTKYGVLDGEIKSISADATQVESNQLLYKAQILLARNSIDVDGKAISIIPGMGVSAEIKTGKREIIDFIFAPLLRYKDESIEER